LHNKGKIQEKSITYKS